MAHPCLRNEAFGTGVEMAVLSPRLLKDSLAITLLFISKKKKTPLLS